jgi:hypothetical protein
MFISTKVLWGKDISCDLCKKRKKCHVILYIKNCLSYIGHKSIFFLGNLANEHKMSICTRTKNSEIQQKLKIGFYEIYTHEPKWISAEE